MERNREFKRLKKKLCKKGKLSHDDMISMKRNLTLEEMLSLLELLNEYPELSCRLFSDAENFHSLLVKRFPYVFSGWKDEHVLEAEIGCELKFLTAQICLKAREIQAFIKIRERFELYFMRGEYLEALAVIDDLEEKYGYSYWGLDSRICVLVLNSRKKFVQFYQENMEVRDDIFLKTYLKTSYYRFLKEVRGTYFNAQLKEIWKNYNKETADSEPNFRTGFQVYITSKIDMNFQYTLYDIRHLLVVSDQLTIIDKYILLEHLLSWLCANSVYNNSLIVPDMLSCVTLLWEKTNAIIWYNMRILLGDNLNITLTPRRCIINSCLKKMCDGELLQCHQLCEDGLVIYSNCFSLIDLLAKSGDCQRNGKPYAELAQFIRSLYLKEGKNSEFTGLVYLCDGYERIYSHFTFGAQLGVVIENETRPINIDEKIRYVSALLQSDYIPSKLTFFLAEGKQTNFIQKYKEALGSLYFSDWHIATYSETEAETLNYFCCDATSRCLNRIKLNSLDRPFDLGEIVKNLDEIGKNICKSFSFKNQFNLSVEHNNILEAITVYVQAYFCSEWMVNTIDYTKIQDCITRDIKSDLEYSIFYCLYAFITRFEVAIGESLSETVISSCKKIISSMPNQSPISLLEDPLCTDEKVKIYFLRNICTYDALRRLNRGKKLVQELYRERLDIIDRIIPFYEANKNQEDLHALMCERNTISSKLSQLDIARCINRGKINTSWIVFSEEAEDAIISMYNLYKNTIGNNGLNEYINIFRMVERDYIKEINRILSITIRHGILEGELLRFIKKGEISTESSDISIQEKNLVMQFIEALYTFLNSLMNNYIVATYKCEDDRKLILHVDDETLKSSFEMLPQEIYGPERLKKEYSDILEKELAKKLASWGRKVCQHIYVEIKILLEELCTKCTGKLQTNVNKVIDLLEYETEKLQSWFTITENQKVKYRLTTLCETLEQEWGQLQVKIEKDLTVTGDTINFLYTVIRELIWNAEKYSGYYGNKINLTVNIYVEEDYIVFKVENNISPEALKVVDMRIAEIQRIINSEEKADQTIIEKSNIYEGKSGYRKITKLLKRKYEGHYKIHIDHTDCVFYVKISFELEVLNS